MNMTRACCRERNVLNQHICTYTVYDVLMRCSRMDFIPCLWPSTSFPVSRLRREPTQVNSSSIRDDCHLLTLPRWASCHRCLQSSSPYVQDISLWNSTAARRIAPRQDTETRHHAITGTYGTETLISASSCVGLKMSEGAADVFQERRSNLWRTLLDIVQPLPQESALRVAERSETLGDYSPAGVANVTHVPEAVPERGHDADLLGHERRPRNSKPREPAPAHANFRIRDPRLTGWKLGRKHRTCKTSQWLATTPYSSSSVVHPRLVV